MRKASRKLEKSNSESSLGQTLTQQSSARANDDHNVHTIVPCRIDVTSGVFDSNENIVGSKNRLYLRVSGRQRDRRELNFKYPCKDKDIVVVPQPVATYCLAV